MLCSDGWLTWQHKESIQRMELGDSEVFLPQCSARRDQLMLPLPGGWRRCFLQLTLDSKGCLGPWGQGQCLSIVPAHQQRPGKTWLQGRGCT